MTFETGGSGASLAMRNNFTATAPRKLSSVFSLFLVCQ